MEVRFCDGCGSQIKSCSWHTRHGYDFCTLDCVKFYEQHGVSGLASHYESPERDNSSR